MCSRHLHMGFAQAPSQPHVCSRSRAAAASGLPCSRAARKQRLAFRSSSATTLLGSSMSEQVSAMRAHVPGARMRRRRRIASSVSGRCQQVRICTHAASCSVQYGAESGQS